VGRPYKKIGGALLEGFAGATAGAAAGGISGAEAATPFAVATGPETVGVGSLVVEGGGAISGATVGGMGGFTMGLAAYDATVTNKENNELEET